MKKRAIRESQRKRSYASSGFESEMAAARAALHDAAKALATLAREEPMVPPKGPEVPHPHPIQRIIAVHPTGHHEHDVRNLEEAIIQAGPGGTVLLKAKDKSGKPLHFNLTKVDELFMEHEVTLKSEKNAVIRFNR